MEYILSLIAIGISIFAWHKNRVIYEVLSEDNKEKVNELLKSGNYTILNVSPHPGNTLRTIFVLGRVK